MLNLKPENNIPHNIMHRNIQEAYKYKKIKAILKTR